MQRCNNNTHPCSITTLSAKRLQYNYLPQKGILTLKRDWSYANEALCARVVLIKLTQNYPEIQIAWCHLCHNDGHGHKIIILSVKNKLALGQSFLCLI